MSCLKYQKHELYIENTPLHEIATRYGTPCYVYSRQRIATNYRAFTQSFESMRHLICYAVKANSNIAILNLLAQLNAGFDIVSAGELARVMAASGNPQKIVFSGVGKTQSEIEAAIKTDVYCFDIESATELDAIAHAAQQFNKKINVALRINPNINPHTHAYISTGLDENKFGITVEDAIALAIKIKSFSNLHLIGIACHIGSQITTLQPFAMMLDCLVELYRELDKQQIKIMHINIGGGLGIDYQDDNPPRINEYAKLVQDKLAHLPITLIIEPGRAIVGDAGVLLMQLLYLKYSQRKNFAIVDAGMNDFMRPALYNAWQQILPVIKRPDIKMNCYDIVGPVCESADFLGKDRTLAILPKDFLAIENTGAYGFSMSSNYNSRPRPAEVLVDGNQTYLIRRRETIQELFEHEKKYNLPQLA